MKKPYMLGMLALGLIIFAGIWIINSDYPRGIAGRNFDLAGGPERVKRGFPQREIIDLASEYPESFLRNGPRGQKRVALSFDDGPDNKYTVEILDILKEKDVQATFFIIGRRAEIFPEVVKRMAAEGHVVGNHTWSHPDILKLDDNDKILEELQKTDQIIQELICYDPKFFRPPYGSIDREILELVTEEGYAVISWDVDSLDWKGLDAAEVKTNILENVITGSIILQHSAGGKGEDLSGTVKALPEIIDVLQKDGYEFVTIDKLLGIDYK